MKISRGWAPLAIAAAILLPSGCSRGGTAATVDAPGVAHVHGLGVDPGDGTLYAATHTGLFTIPAKGRAKRVADRYQDTMAFTVVGPRRFLGSGHPDIQDRQMSVPGTPPLIGLIESRDAGVTWKKRSLFGEADFHALVAAPGLVYGYDSTGDRLLVSSDQKTWETRSTGVTIDSLAVSPADADRLLAATANGVVSSADGGRTFAAVAGAPSLALIAWTPARGLWGIAADGVVSRAAAPEGPWTAAGTLPGEPEAFLVTDDAVFAAVMSADGRSEIYRSSDDGATWKRRYRDPSPIQTAP